MTVLSASGEQQTVYTDGTRRRQLTDGSEEVLLPSGEYVSRCRVGDHSRCFLWVGGARRDRIVCQMVCSVGSSARWKTMATAAAVDVLSENPVPMTHDYTKTSDQTSTPIYYTSLSCIPIGVFVCMFAVIPCFV